MCTIFRKLALLSLVPCLAWSADKPPPSLPGREAGSFNANFDDAPAGRCPDHWKIASTHAGKTLATWQAVADPAAPSAPNVFRLTRTDNRGGTFNLAIAHRTSLADVEVSVKVRADTGKEDQGGGLIWRCRDENNYYICRINPLESNYRVYKVVDGRRTQLASARVKTAVGRWYTLRAVMVGERIACHLDGREVLTAQDGALGNAGSVGLWTKADAASSFDDFDARALEQTAKPGGSPDRRP
jgi:hypothetical protein